MLNYARASVHLVTLSHALVYEVVVVLSYHSLRSVKIVVLDLGQPTQIEIGHFREGEKIGGRD